MIEDFADLPGLPPEDLIRATAATNPDEDIRAVIDDLAIANNSLESIESAVAVDIVGCLQDGMACDEECERCIKGQLDSTLRNIQVTIDKVDHKISTNVQDSLSTAIQAGTNVGIPITDLILVNGQPITNEVPVEPVQPEDTPTISVQICPPGTTPILTGNGTIYCLPDSTPPETIEAVEAGTTIPPDSLLQQTVSIPLPSPTPVVQPISTPSQPTQIEVSQPVAPVPGRPPIPTQPPAQPPPVPPIPSQPPPAQPPPAQPPATADQLAFEGANRFNFVCIDGDWIGVGTARVRYPELLHVAFSFVADNQRTGERYWEIPNQSLPNGWSSRSETFCFEGNTFCSTYGCAIPGKSTPPPNPPVECPSEPPPSGVLPTVGGIELCDPQASSRLLGQVDSFDKLLSGDANQIIKSIGNALGFQPNKDRGFLDLISNPTEVFTSVLGGLAIGLTQTLLKAASAINFLTENCSSGAFAATSAVSAFSDVFGGWFGIIPDQIRVTNTYARNLTCQYVLPTYVEANALWNRGFITDDQWTFLTKAAGICVPWNEEIRKLGQSVPTIDQAAMMERRSLISYDEYKKFAQRNGVLDDADKAAFYNLTEYVPGPSDLVRFMVRDVFDPQVVTSQQLDTDFEKKFTGKAKEWARSQGMSEDQFRSYWYAHWDYPSNTQLYTMLHRLREDTPIMDGAATAKRVTAEDIKRTLQINDVSPEWVDRLIAISYSPLTRVDARRAFEIGELGPDGLREAYLDLGYSPDNADILLEFSKATSGPIRAKKLGHASTAEVLGWYREQLISRELASTLLERSGVKSSAVATHLDSVDLRRSLGFRREAIKALRKRFMSGEFSTREMQDQLSRVGMDNAVIGELLFQWGLVRDAKYKAPTVAMLCKWWQRGLITVSDFIQRCQNLGFKLEDAERIASTCQGEQADRLAKDRERLAKEAAAAERRRQSDQRRFESDLRRQRKEGERLAKELAPCKPPPKPTCPTPEGNGVPEQ